MRVLYWTELFWPEIGGVEVLSVQLINALQKRGHEFFVISSRGSPQAPEQETHNGVHIHRFFFRTAMHRRQVGQIQTIRQRVAQLKSEIQPDLVHLNCSSVSHFFYELTANIAPAPMLFTIHSPFRLSLDKNTLMARLLLSSERIIAVSNAMLQNAREEIPEIASRVSVIHNSLQDPHLEPAPLSVDPPRILYLGRFAPNKGIDLAIDAFALLLKRYPNARLLIAGDGVIRPALEHQVIALGLAESVDFLGWVAPERVYELINTVSLMVVPSRYNEPFGLVALQAGQMARPVVAARMGGLAEIVVDQQTGLLVENEDRVGLANAMACLLAHPQRASEMGLAARRRVDEVFGWERFVDAYDALYRELGKRRNP